MQSANIQFTLLLLLICSTNEAIKLRECGEFDQSDIVTRILERNSKPMPFQDELGDIFDAFNSNNTERMGELFKLLENKSFVDFDDEPPTGFAENIIKYVVCTVH